MAVLNHPVHIINNEGQLSPSAFIPFCEFGGSMSAMGVKIKQFDIPVCNSFQDKIFNNQLCYEVDLNRFSKKSKIKTELKFGLILLMDYNEDRQVTFRQEENEICEDMSMARNILKLTDNQDAIIYFNSIGK